MNYSQTYYVDYLNGSDTNDGSSASSSFKHSPGDIYATDIPAGITLEPGDIVQFKSGVKYKGQIIVSESGTADNFIIFKGSGWGNGKAIFDMELLRSFAFKSGQKYLEFSGFEFYRWPRYSPDNVIDVNSGASNWKIDNCVFAFVEDWNLLEENPTQAALYLSSSTKKFWITNCEFFATGHQAITLSNVDSVWIQNCDFGGINRGENTGYFSTAIVCRNEGDHIWIQDNTFHDGWQYGGDQDPELTHSPDWIHIYGNSSNSSQYPEDITIERNYFYINHQFDIGTGTGFMSISTNVYDVKIRNNVFVNSCQFWGGSVMISNGADNILVESNTFISRDYINNSIGWVIPLSLLGGAEAPGNNIWIYNNIFYNDDERIASVCIRFGMSNFGGECDYNSYYTTDQNKVFIVNESVESLDYWTGLGFDQNSIFETNGSNIFADFPSSPELSGQGDYKLNPDYAVNLIDKGIVRNGFNDSFDGAVRPQGNGWDIGAYEYSLNSSTDGGNKWPRSIQLYQNYPNPFNPFTTIQFENSEDAFISLEIYNSVGEKVATLINNVVEAGIHTIKFDSSEIASGIYIYKIVSGKYSESKKMVLLK
jgi:hypothetical protein